MPAVGGAISNEGKPDWQVPPSWKEIPGGQFLVAKFIITAADNFPGDRERQLVGWRRRGPRDERQSLAGVRSAWDACRCRSQPNSPKPLTIGSGKAELGRYDRDRIEDWEQKTRVLAAMVPQGQQLVYKAHGVLTRPMESNKDAFLAFVQTARYH